jgi:hypothetical protein
MSVKPGVCVKLPDGRVGRVRDKHKNGEWRVRVMRKTSNSHQFLFFKSNQLKVISCPTGWMSVEGYNSYLKKTLAKMKEKKNF